MIKRLLGVAALAAISLSACASSTYNAQPADVFAAGLGQSDVRSLMGDTNWWEGPPSFGVLPLDAATADLSERFSVTNAFIHLGSDEQLVVRYTVYDKASSATAQMTALKNRFSTSATSPKAGDDVLYTGIVSTGAAPFVFRTFVRVSQIIATIVWTHKDLGVTTKQLARNAVKVADGLKKMIAAKAHATPIAVDKMFLPPPGLDITFLGATQLPIEAWAVMRHAASPGPVIDLIHTEGVTDFAYGDYALNNDTHMEVRTALLNFPTTAAAAEWASAFAPGTPDSNGIAGEYLPVGGTPAAGEYHYLFISGHYGASLICKASLDGEAASRECEAPMGRTALSWKLALQG